MLIAESKNEETLTLGRVRAICCIFIAVVLVCTFASRSVFAVERHKFNVMQNTLGEALVAIAQQSNSQLLFPYHLAKTTGMNPVVGRYTLSDALDILLQGSGFSGGLTERGIITVSRVESKQQPIREAKVTVNQRKKTLLGTISALLLGTGSGATANDTDKDVAFEMEEVVVVARKRSENLQSVPIAITAVTSETIERVGALGLSDLSAISPSAEITSGGFIALRGIGDSARNIGNGARAVVYVDGAPVGRSYAFEQDLLDVERVEILRGPQGTLFGKNSVSGAINIVTKKPHEDFEGEVAAEYGNVGRFQLNGRVNVPLSDGIYLSVQGGYHGEDGSVDNIHTGNNLGGSDRYSGRAKLLVAPSDNLELMFSIDYLEDSILRHSSPVITGPGSIEAPGLEVVSIDAEGIDQRKYKAGTFNLDYDFENGFSLTSITSYRENEFSEVFDEDYSSLDIARSFFDEKSDQFTQEVRLSSPSEGNYDFIIGAFYSKADLSTERSAEVGPNFEPVPGFQLGTRLSVVTPGEVSDEGVSGFFHGNYRFTEQLELSAGLRFTHQQKSIDYSIIDQIGVFTNFENFQETKTDNEWSPKVTLNYQFNDDVFGYATFSRTFKSGGWNADFVTTIERLGFDAEYANNYELGLKSTMFDSRLRVNLAGFVTKFTDYQVFQFIPLSNGGTIISITNAGEVTTRGIEVETVALPLEGLTLTTNYSFIDAYYNSFRDGGGPGVDFDGNKIDDTAKHNVYFAADYQLDVTADSYLTFHGDFTYRGSRFSDRANTEAARIGARNFTNFRIGLINEATGLELYAWADNVFNNKYLSGIGRSFGGDSTQSLSRGRTAGVKARYRF